MKRLRRYSLPLAGIFLVLLVTFPIWAMGPAVFLDSERTVLSSVPSPDGRRIAQVERLVVGGVPQIVLMVRPWWTPNWYLSGCSAIYHYREARAAVTWTGPSAIGLRYTDEPRFWWTNAAPFQSQCGDIYVSLLEKIQ